MSLFPLLASLIMAGAGCGAIAAIAITVRAQLPAVRKLLVDSRAIAADRDFLVRITAQTTPAMPLSAARPRRMSARVIRFVPMLVPDLAPDLVPMRAEESLRAAA